MLQVGDRVKVSGRLQLQHHEPNLVGGHPTGVNNPRQHQLDLVVGRMQIVGRVESQLWQNSKSGRGGGGGGVVAPGRAPMSVAHASAIAPLPPSSFRRLGEGGDEEDLYAELTLEDILVVEDARELAINSQKSCMQ